MQEGPPYERFLVGLNPTVLRLAERLTAIRAWCEQDVLRGR